MATYFNISDYSNDTQIIQVDLRNNAWIPGTDWVAQFAAAVEKLLASDKISKALIEINHCRENNNSQTIMQLLQTCRTPEALFAHLQRLHTLLRRLEQSGKTLVARVDGTIDGFAAELSLVCRYVFCASDSDSFAMTHLQKGLFPSAGGAQRLLRTIGIEASIPLLFSGQLWSGDRAREAGLVTGSADSDKALAFLADSVAEPAPWDRPDFAVPGGAGQETAALRTVMSTLHGTLLASTCDHFFPPHALLFAVYEGSLLPMDSALNIDAQYAVEALRDPHFGCQYRTLWESRAKADALHSRPQPVAAAVFASVAVLGAGMMGAGIAWSCAAAGMQVILLDRDISIAERGKHYSVSLVSAAINRGEMSGEQGDKLLARIHPTTDYSDLRACSLVIEAVFEDVDIKRQVIQAAEQQLPQQAIIATNTSTLKISKLATFCSRPDRFVGLHFASPVDRMPILEIIPGSETSDETLAESLDFSVAIGKTPVVVNDHWGFYMSRTLGTYTNQGLLMLSEGIAPALIENAAKQCGMPVGPLAGQDEISLDLAKRIMESLMAVAKDEYTPPRSYAMLKDFVDRLGRLGRKSGGGFYDYPDAAAKRLWPGLRDEFPPAAQQPCAEHLQQRFLYIQCVEAARCLQEGVLASPADGDVCAVVGWNFPAYTGGPFSLMDAVGLPAFVRAVEQLAAQHGDEFAPPQLLIDMAANNQRFYDAAF